MEEFAIIALFRKIFGLITGNKYIAMGVAAALLIAISVLVFHHEVKKDVKAQVTQHDAIASAVATKTEAKTAAATAAIDKVYDAKALTVHKEYEHVRTTVSDPVAAQQASAGKSDALNPLLLDTLNQLARLHAHSGSDSTEQSPD